MPNRKGSRSTDAFVAGKKPVEVAEPTKRLTLDIPASLHSRIKASCAIRENPLTMVAAIRELLDREFPEAQ